MILPSLSCFSLDMQRTELSCSSAVWVMSQGIQMGLDKPQVEKLRKNIPEERGEGCFSPLLLSAV